MVSKREIINPGAMLYFETFLYLLFIPIILSNRSVYKLLHINKTVACAILLFLIALITAQVLNNQKYSYPFAYWGMYSSVYTEPGYREYEIELQDGTKKHYPFREVAFTAPSIVMRKIERLPESDTEQRLLKKSINGLIAIYEKHHEKEQVKRFTIRRVQFDIDANGNYTVTKTKLFEWGSKQ